MIVRILTSLIGIINNVSWLGYEGSQPDWKSRPQALKPLPTEGTVRCELHVDVYHNSRKEYEGTHESVALSSKT